MTVSPNDLSHFTYQQMFFKNATVWIVCFNDHHQQQQQQQQHITL